jgi:hypothetical protein
MLQAGTSRARFPITSLDFSIDIILPAALWPWGPQPQTEMSTRNLPGVKGRSARKADNLTACLENVGASTSDKPMGLHGLLQGHLYIF